MLLSSDCHPVGLGAAICQGSQAQTPLGHTGLLEVQIGVQTGLTWATIPAEDNRISAQQKTCRQGASLNMHRLYRGTLFIASFAFSGS